MHAKNREQEVSGVSEFHSREFHILLEGGGSSDYVQMPVFLKQIFSQQSRDT